MAGYPHLSKIPDPATQAALKNAFDQINQLKQELITLQAQVLLKPTLTAEGINIGGIRLTNVANPTSETDALNVGFARQLIQAQVEAFGV